ncbi:MAG: BamA/TamA family outer membrane protein [Armatimonas sp.]
MSWRLQTIGLAAVAAIVAPAWAQTPAQEGLPIAEIEVVGTVNTPPEVVKLAAGGAGIKEGQIFRAEILKKAEEALEARGLYSSVRSRVETRADKRLKIIFEVIENPVVRSVRLEGVRALPMADLLSLVTLEPGKILNRAALEASVLAIRNEYKKRGYIAEVVEQVEIDPRTGVLTIPITEITVEDIQVQGLTKTQKFVVLRELRTKMGEPYNERVFQEDLNRLLNLRIFQNVTALTPEPGSDIGKVKLTVVVVEQRTGQVGVQFGYDQRQRLTGTLQLSEGNFNGKNQALNAEWTVAGGIARNSYSLSFSEPWVDKKNTSVGVSVYDQSLFRFNRIFATAVTNDVDTNQYYEQRRGGSIRVGRPLTADRFTRAFASARTESVRSNNLRPNYDLLTDAEINNIRGSLVQTGNISSVSFGTTSQPVDNINDPSRGYFFEPSIEIGAGNFHYERPRLNPDYISATETPNIPRVLVDTNSAKGPFTKYNLELRKYWSLNGQRVDLTEPKRVLATRLLLGRASGTLAFNEQYFIGGVDSLRGYYDDRFWGNNQLLLNTELRVPFDKQGQLGGTLFVDIGDAWGASDINRDSVAGFEQRKSFRPNVGYGLGLRVRIPLGVVRLDYGFAQNGRGRGHFAIGVPW